MGKGVSVVQRIRGQTSAGWRCPLPGMPIAVPRARPQGQSRSWVPVSSRGHRMCKYIPRQCYIEKKSEVGGIKIQMAFRPFSKIVSIFFQIAMHIVKRKIQTV